MCVCVCACVCVVCVPTLKDCTRTHWYTLRDREELHLTWSRPTHSQTHTHRLTRSSTHTHKHTHTCARILTRKPSTLLMYPRPTSTQLHTGLRVQVRTHTHTHVRTHLDQEALHLTEVSKANKHTTSHRLACAYKYTHTRARTHAP